MIKACIFDLDGVIVDTAKYHFQAWKKLANLLEIPFSEDDNEKMKGISRTASLDMLLSLGNLSISDADKQKYCMTKNLWYLEFVNQMKKDEILPGISDFMTHLKDNNIKFALGSASKNARHILQLTGLTNEFDAIVDGNDVVNSKPDPEVFLKGADLLNTSPSETIVFEDSAKGIDAALEGGFIAVGKGEEQYLGHAHVVIKDFTGLSIHYLKEEIFGEKIQSSANQ